MTDRLTPQQLTEYYLTTDTQAYRNHLDLNRDDLINKAMSIRASIALHELNAEPDPQVVDLAYLQHIHRTLFSAVVPWAGELRLPGAEAEAGRGGQLIYADSTTVHARLRHHFAGLHQRDYFRGLGRWQFADQLARFWGDVAYTHPFIDGNTRSQSALVDRIARMAGHSIDWSSLDILELRMAKIEAAFNSQPRALANMLEQHMSAYRGQPSSLTGYQVPGVKATGATTRLQDQLARLRAIEQRTQESPAQQVHFQAEVQPPVSSIDI